MDSDSGLLNNYNHAQILMKSITKSITGRSTLTGFKAVLLFCIAVVVILLIQIDSWSRAGFERIKNNTQQARLIFTLQGIVQQRELIMQRVLNLEVVAERRLQSRRFLSFEPAYLNARQQLSQTYRDKALDDYLNQLDTLAASAQLYYDDLHQQLMTGQAAKAELNTLFLQSCKAVDQVLVLLGKMADVQYRSYKRVVSDYEQSRLSALLGVGGVFVLISLVVLIAIRASNKQFRYVSRLSIIDEVSGIYNRRYFDMVLEEEWKRSMREYTPLSLLMLDIDFFKAYNDTYGHQVGDVCLYSVGKILSAQLQRASDFTARYGGEEFAIVLPNTSLEHARMLAERIRRAVEEARIKSGDDRVSPWLTVSVGVATAMAEFGQLSSGLVRAADNCLYESKRSGRNKVCDRRVKGLE
ncbi:diguanylate cyclase/phosphodiesterase (GGDEF & EAL domains) with PAS/PAC sensor(s) [hydrothermal vent metagenome]|uniref:Diguanylate cyclase/phosphodiesterase (GGDEF & EAL domains) with PAS/PAC sensor(S) n=1 Tax=hydrothermal vent metagenome TaxID=652676 RepID=A0A3B0XNT4_9ZZZZ